MPGQLRFTPGSDALAHANLESRLLVLQLALAGFFCAGVYAGLFGVSGALGVASIGWIASYHAFHAFYVIRYRLAFRPIRWLEAATPLGDVTCITAGWAALGDPYSPFWALYLYALVGYARRYDGRNYWLVAGFILVNVIGGRMLISVNAPGAAIDARLATIIALTAAMAALANAIGGAWRRAERKARRLADTDPLTGIANRRTFLERIDELSQEPSATFSVLMLDLDDFKRLNDEFGHLHGDAVLVDVARILSDNIRPEDRLARYGGEEFVVAMPGCSLQDAVHAAERLRAGVASASPTTVSVGCAARHPGENAESVLRRADDLLLTAKRTGKNSVRSTPLRKSA